MREAVIVAAGPTPIGKLRGSLTSFRQSVRAGFEGRSHATSHPALRRTSSCDLALRYDATQDAAGGVVRGGRKWRRTGH
jgi:hypothetical protein